MRGDWIETRQILGIMTKITNQRQASEIPIPPLRRTIPWCKPLTIWDRPGAHELSTFGLFRFREGAGNSSNGFSSIMRFTTDILTALTAFCLFGNGFALATREKQFHQLILEEWTNGDAASNAVFVGVQCNEQGGDHEVHRFGVPDTGARSSAQPLQEAALPKGRLLFASNSVKLKSRNRKSLECAAAWLRQHPVVRVLIVGYCDDSGSEACTAALAEHGAEVVRQFLLSLGTRADQIAGVKGWENQGGLCRAGATECQRQNRSARLFVAEPTGSLK